MPAIPTQTALRVIPAPFTEPHPALRDDEALAEAARCLYCYDAPCTRACPTHIDIPRFIRQILHRDPLGAARTILDANIFGGSCARVCPTEVLCEGACVDNTHLKQPVLIGRLQRHACDHSHDASRQFYSAGRDTGRRVAIVGAGPAGLTCAHELRQRGHGVTVFEARNVAGGLNTLGIAAYKISTDFALSEVERVLAIGGIELRLRSPVNGPRLKKLLAEYDAVFLAIGLGHTAPLGIPGEDLPGVVESLEFIFQTHTKPPQKCRVGKHVLVIGGGNTATDVAIAALRLGAESATIAYRRGHEQMPAFAHEFEHARAAGVRFEWNAQPLRILARARRVIGVRFARTRAQRGRSGPPPRPLPGRDFTLPCDTVVKALGQERIVDLLAALPALGLTADGRIDTQPASGATSIPGLFAGGDCQGRSGEEVVNAVQDGKLAAAGIHEYLTRVAAGGSR